MALQQIDAKMLSKMFLAGAKNLENKKEWINELNVFPVPDGDTGTNMTMTIMSAAREVSALGEDADMAALCKAISSGSLRGARGNSGVILSQLFRGFTKSIKEEQVLDIPVLTRAFDKAVETAYKAVMKPKEGTILTVARGASDKAKELCEDGAEDLEQFLGSVIEHARYVLSQTPEMLPVLKQAGVVDSGGQSFRRTKGGFCMKKYQIIYADPPWNYKVYSKKGLGRSAESHYPTMSIEDICALPVGNLADKDCALFLWVTIPCLLEGLSVLKAWGFTYKTVGFVWVKQNRKADSLFWGMGYWTRSNVELCILATKGHPKRINAAVHQVIVSHIEEHSKKPQEARERIVSLMGDLPRIELFARQSTPGWDVWGNEVDSSISFP